jgi:hypothetical protein
MAQMTPEEFIDALESVTESLRNNKTANQQQAEQLLKSIGIDKTRADEVLKASKAFGSSSLNMTKGMASGADSAKQMANSLDMVVTGLELLLSLIPGYRLLKVGILLATKALSGLTKAATEQAQAEFKAYQQLNQIGAAGAEGLRGVFDTVQKFGYNVNELDKMVALVAANSESLAAFGGLASQGTTAFADAMNQLTHGQVGIELGALGKNLDDINGAGAAYIRMQTLLGRTQQQVGYDLAGKTKQYIMDLDRLQRLTGTSADALQKQQQAALMDSAYASYIDNLEASGEAGAAQAKNIRDVLATLPKEMQDLARRGIGGDVGAAQQLNFIAPSLIKNLRDGSATFENTVGSVNQDLRNFKEKFGQAYQYNAEGMDQFGLKYATVSEGIAKTSDIRRRSEEASIEAANAGAKNDVKNMATAEVLSRQNTASLQEMLQKGVGPATTALEFFAKVTNAASGALPGSKNVTTGAGSVPVGASPGVVPGRSVTIGGQVRSGGDRNWRNNNPGNIEYGPFAISMGAVGSDGRFAIFPSEEMGRKAADTLLKGKSYANLSAADALKKWAPETENNIQAYASNMAKQGVDLNKRYVDMTPDERTKFLDAMNKVEGGRAGSVSGPNSRYDAKTASINPASTLPASYDGAQARAAAQNTQNDEMMASWNSRLEEQVRLQREANDKLAAIRTNTR